MLIDHEKLTVYQFAHAFLLFSHRAAQRVPRGCGYLADQLRRAASSITLNIAEGALKQSRADKRRYYLTARGSAGECAALLDALVGFEIIGQAEFVEQKARVVSIAAMLSKMAISMDGGRRFWGERERGNGKGERTREG